MGDQNIYLRENTEYYQRTLVTGLASSYHSWPPFFGGNRAYSTAKATVKAAKPHLNPLSSTSDNVTARAKPPEYLQASLLPTETELTK